MNDSMDSLCNKLDAMRMKDLTMSINLSMSAAGSPAAPSPVAQNTWSPAWPSFSPGSSPVSASKAARCDVANAAGRGVAATPPGSPLRAIGGMIPSLRPAAGSLAMMRSPARSPPRSPASPLVGRNKAKQNAATPVRALSTRGAAGEVVMPQAPVNLSSMPVCMSAKKAKQRRHR